MHPNSKNNRNSANASAIGAPGGADGSLRSDPSSAFRRLRQRLGEDKFGSWFAKLRLVSIEGDLVTFAASTRFLATHIRTHFEADVVAAWRADHPNVRRVEIVVAATNAAMPTGPPAAAAAGRTARGRA